MDETLRIIRHLYDEESDGDARDALERRLSEDKALRREYDVLRSTKDALDRRPADGPDPDVVDRIVAAAADASRRSDRVTSDSSHNGRVPGARDDRSPRRSDARRAADASAEASWTRRLRWGAATLAVVLAVSIGWWTGGPTASEWSASTAETPSAASAPASQERAADARAESADLPAWDEGDEVVRLHRRIELVQARSAPSQWNGGLQPASQQLRP